jgi:hypothetical protein
VLNFLLTQGTSASAKQYSVQVIHTFISFRDFGFIDGTSFAKSFGCAGRIQKRLTAHLADMLISIRRRRVGAEREGNKASIDEGGFGRCQFPSPPANQYSVLIVHIFLLSLCWAVHRVQTLSKELPRLSWARLISLFSK